MAAVASAILCLRLASSFSENVAVFIILSACSLLSAVICLVRLVLVSPISTLSARSFKTLYVYDTTFAFTSMPSFSMMTVTMSHRSMLLNVARFSFPLILFISWNEALMEILGSSIPLWAYAVATLRSMSSVITMPSSNLSEKSTGSHLSLAYRSAFGVFMMPSESFTRISSSLVSSFL